MPQQNKGHGVLLGEFWGHVGMSHINMSGAQFYLGFYKVVDFSMASGLCVLFQLIFAMAFLQGFLGFDKSPLSLKLIMAHPLEPFALTVVVKIRSDQRWGVCVTQSGHCGKSVCCVKACKMIHLL